MPSAIHHLKRELYTDPKNSFRIHVGLRRNAQVFVGDIGAKAAGTLRAYLTKHAIPTHAWLILPDRISLIIQPTPAKSIFTITDDIKKLLEKNILPKNTAFFDDFLDHILRKSEDPKVLSAELLESLMHLGIAKTPKDYPLCGSFLYELEHLSCLMREAV